MPIADSVRIKEIHAVLGAGEYATYIDGNSQVQDTYMHIARTVDLMAKSLGISYNPDGTILSINLNLPPAP